VLRPGGLLTFASFGPDTLMELRRAWAAVDDHVHVGRFITCTTWATPCPRRPRRAVMDVERLVLTYAECGT